MFCYEFYMNTALVQNKLLRFVWVLFPKIRPGEIFSLKWINKDSFLYKPLVDLGNGTWIGTSLDMKNISRTFFEKQAYISKKYL